MKIPKRKLTGALGRCLQCLVGFGDFTSRGFRAGPAGVQPAARPRNIIEPLPDPGNRDLAGSASYLYRVTAMGFGPREDIQAVAQIIYRN